MHSQKEISELPDESEDIFKKNMLHRHMDRPDEKFQYGKFASVNYVIQNFLDSTMFLLYQMKMIGSLWNLLMTC